MEVQLLILCKSNKYQNKTYLALIFIIANFMPWLAVFLFIMSHSIDGSHHIRYYTLMGNNLPDSKYQSLVIPPLNWDMPIFKKSRKFLDVNSSLFVYLKEG